VVVEGRIGALGSAVSVRLVWAGQGNLTGERKRKRQIGAFEWCIVDLNKTLYYLFWSLVCDVDSNDPRVTECI
jgi:hypothetical protein